MFAQGRVCSGSGFWLVAYVAPGGDQERARVGVGGGGVDGEGGGDIGGDRGSVQPVDAGEIGQQRLRPV